ncbi:CocE/NonD family hydrolase [Tabrizicola sp. BL-A-41-H6]|uniref:CocE/NonD family hydrolase n=1 Tax=Tabrizicola sp. BL-A-41-H6 TaxID=3421107 RepID=UPI003D67F845
MRAVSEIPDQGIVMPDGVRLSARLWLPQDAGVDPVPAILEMIPYRKRDGTAARDAAIHPWFAARGYACLRVDLRGAGDSEGLLTDEYTAEEWADACAVIEWAAAQPWCSGTVGMMGKSWGAFNALQVAALQPPALEAVIAVCGTVDRFGEDIHFKGGCLLGENFGWASVMLSYSSRPADPLLRLDWREDWLLRLDGNPWLAPRWAAEQARGDYWRHGSVCEDWGKMTVPVLAVGGWADGYMNMVGALVENAVGPVKGIVGPWVHLYPHMAVPGPQIGFLTEALRWWDRWLKGVPNGVEAEAPTRVYMLDAAVPDASAAFRPGRWLALPEGWQADRVVLPLGQGLGDAGGVRTVIATPQHLGAAAGEYFPTGLNGEMAGDQAADDALSVCFDGPVLEAPLELIGAARVRLTVASDKPLGFVVARLCDVAPDGASVRIAHGMLNLCNRGGADAPRPVVPCEAMTVEVTLDQMAYRVAAGHRVRLALSNTYWPFLWPSPEAGRLMVTGGELDLPVHRGGTEEWVPPAPEPSPASPHRVLREGVASRETRVDADGRHWVVVRDDTGDFEDLSHGLRFGEGYEERWQILPDDPLSAKVEIVWEQRLSRGDWSVRTRSETAMSGSADALRMEARLTAWEGETEVFARVWDERVPRRFV